MCTERSHPTRSCMSRVEGERLAAGVLGQHQPAVPAEPEEVQLIRRADLPEPEKLHHQFGQRLPGFGSLQIHVCLACLCEGHGLSSCWYKYKQYMFICQQPIQLLDPQEAPCTRTPWLVKHAYTV